MKRFVAIWVVCALLLCCVCAGAEGQSATVQAGESEGWRLSNDMTVDPALFHALLERLCPDLLARKSAEKLGALLDALEPSLTVTDDALQLDIGLNGKSALSLGGARTEDGVVIVSSLFPNYAVSVYTGKVMQIVSEITPMVVRPKKDAPAEAAPAAEGDLPQVAADSTETAPPEAPPSDSDSDDFLPVEEMTRYVDIAQPEPVEYQVDGVSYDVKRTYSLNCDGLVGIWNTLVDWVFNNKGIASLLEIAREAELEISVDQIKAALPAEALPRLNATFYSSSATADRLITATAASEDGAKVYGDARIRISEDDVIANLHVPPLTLDIDFEMHHADGFQAALDARGKEPLLHATFNSDDAEMHGTIELPALQSDARFVLTQQHDGPEGQLEINAGGNYLGSDFEVAPFDASGDGLRFTASLYYTDDRNPLFREELTLQPHGSPTLGFTDAAKTVVPITSLINVSNGYLVGFILDIAFNGIGGLLDATANVLSTLKQNT